MALPLSRILLRLALGGAVVGGAALLLAGPLGGHFPSIASFLRGESAADELPPERRRVSGASMAPTIFGPSRHVGCPRCDVNWVIQAVPNLSTPVLCSHCGGEVRAAEKLGAETSAGEVVTIAPFDAASDSTNDDRAPARGEIVAVGGINGRPDFLKRVVAVPGDVIGIAPNGSELTVNDQPIALQLAASPLRIPLPWFPVDWDLRRSQSRWTSESECGWSRSPERVWKMEAPVGLHDSVGSDWTRGCYLTYHHQSVYDDHWPSAILDDYQYNVAVVRTLQPVDRLRLSGRLRCVDQAKLEVVFWSRSGPVVVRAAAQNGSTFRVASSEGSAWSLPAAGIESQDGSAVPVSATDPVALRVSGESVEISGLTLERLVEYRLRPRDHRESYPRRLAEDEYFLLGDNVPVSIDSRELGPIRRGQLRGIVTSIDRD